MRVVNYMGYPSILFYSSPLISLIYLGDNEECLLQVRAGKWSVGIKITFTYCVVIGD